MRNLKSIFTVIFIFAFLSVSAQSKFRCTMKYAINGNGVISFKKAVKFNVNEATNKIVVILGNNDSDKVFTEVHHIERKTRNGYYTDLGVYYAFIRNTDGVVVSVTCSVLGETVTYTNTEPYKIFYTLPKPVNNGR